MMTSAEECPCSETTDSSSAIPVAMEPCSITNTSELSDSSARPHTNMNNDCTCQADEKLPPTYTAPLVNCVKPASVSQKPQRGSFKSVTHFEPAMECLCHLYKEKFFSLPDNRRSAERFNWKWPRREYARRKDKLQDLKVKRNHYRHYSKPFGKYDLMDGIPRVKIQPNAMDNENSKSRKDTKQELEEISERIDIYYFDHGNSAYYRTTDSPPLLATERCAEKTDSAATRFWAEIFGTVHIGIAFVTAFVLQLLRFVLFSIIRPLTVGVLQLLADYFVKPFLVIFFNAVIQPVLILVYNIATSLRDLSEPIAEAFGFFLREIATVVRAFRIVEVNRIGVPASVST